VVAYLVAPQQATGVGQYGTQVVPDGNSDGSMAETFPKPGRIAWLDGLRGFAAMQVVLLHYVFAFLPTIGLTYPLPMHDFWWRGLVSAPLVYLYDGASAVYLFFIMSGVALTYAFSAGPFAFLSAIARRTIRLGLPMAAAMLLAAAWYSLLPDAHILAAGRSGSPWLRDIGPEPRSVAALAHQIALEGLLAGYKGQSLLPGSASLGLSLSTTQHGFDAPLWTLHLEFYGSLLVMLLVQLRASTSRAAYHAICVILGFAFVLSPLSLFIIGHLAAFGLQRRNGRARPAVLGAALLGSGVLLCAVPTILPVSGLWKLLPPPPLGLQGDVAVLQKMIGAVLIFGGLALLPALQRHLARPPMRRLGKISFSLYLTHCPLLGTGVAVCFTWLSGILPYGAATAVTCIAGIAACLVIAIPFEHWIDRPSILLGRSVGASRRKGAETIPAIETA
jgi:peptidoglycan/LPS O-acetylase OafA/YrhL